MSKDLSKSKILIYFCLSFISGILINSLVVLPRSIWLGILILGAGLIIFGLKKKEVIVLGFCLIVLVVGIWRHQIIKIEGMTELISQYYEKEISFKGIIIDEPEKRINQIKFQVQTKEIPGKILVTTELYPEYHYGDQLEIKGKLKQPARFEDFDYQQYLAKDRIFLVIYHPAIKLLAQNQANWLYQRIFDFKDKLRTVIEQTLLPPQGAVLKAILLGDEGGLSNDWKTKLNLTSTRHIIAISGMNMVIIAQVFLFLALALGLWRGQAFYFVVVLLAGYILMIGAPASALRAGLMSGLLLLAQKTGRLRSADRAVILAATIMLAINPSLLKADIGFQLSFAATLGIIYLVPILNDKTGNWPNPFYLKDVLVMTLAAQLAVLPLLVFHFSQLSLISPLANLLVVPFSSLIMILGLILVSAGLIWLGLAKIIVWPVWLLLSFMVKVVDYFSLIPWAAIELKNISWLIVIGYYLALFFIILKCSKTKNLLMPS